MRSLAKLRPHHRGIRMPITTSNWVMPSVATVTTNLGELRNRRINANSMTTPATIAITSPAARTDRYGQPQKRMNAAENAVGTVPSSAWAKLTTLLAR